MAELARESEKLENSYIQSLQTRVTTNNSDSLKATSAPIVQADTEQPVSAAGSATTKPASAKGKKKKKSKGSKASSMLSYQQKLRKQELESKKYAEALLAKVESGSGASSRTEN